MDGGPATAALPEVVIRVCAGRDVVLVVQDKGGGIDADKLAQVWGYGYTTFKPPSRGDGLWEDFHERLAGPHAQQDLFAGYGFGLPRWEFPDRHFPPPFVMLSCRIVSIFPIILPQIICFIVICYFDTDTLN